MTTSRRRALVIAGSIAILGATGLGWSRLPASSAAQVNTLDSASGAAIKGYDPVAYFAIGKPTRGSADHAVMFNGAKWLFANAENKSLFENAPEKYAPAYGGYCAYGVSQGYLVKIEPDAWSIRNGRLYLNYDTTVRRQWEQAPADYIRAADKKWPALIKNI